MNTKESAIQKFLENNFKNGLQGYFDGDSEKAESTIVKNASRIPIAPTKPTKSTKLKMPILFVVKEDSKGYGKRYSVEITVKASDFIEFGSLRGQLLRNRSRIESNLLTAIRRLSSDQLWDASIIGKVTVIVQ